MKNAAKKQKQQPVKSLNFPVTEDTAVMTPKIEGYIQRFEVAANKSAAAIIETARVVYEASQELLDQEFDLFCLRTRLNRTPSVTSKLKAIGKRFDLLSKHVNRLPATWTTLYKIAKLSDDEFNKAVGANLIHSTMTGNELKDLAPHLFKSKSGSSASKSEPQPDLSLHDFSIKAKAAWDATNLTAFRDALAKLCAQFQCDIVGEPA